MTIAEVTKIANEYLAGSDKFLVDVLVKPTNRVFVFIDGDQGVTIDDCVKLSRHIESTFDRETEDLELNVSSCGADQPLRFSRQYAKNAGRMLQVKLDDDSIVSGKLVSADASGIVIITNENKKKKVPSETFHLAFNKIKEAKVIISFK